MAKTTDNTNTKKKVSDTIKSKDDKISRGRPSNNKPEVVTEQPKDDENLKSTSKLKQEAKSEFEPEPQIKPEPILSETELLTKEIYGDTDLISFVPFPQSEQKVQTISIISEYNIDRSRLPIDVALLVDDFANDFTVFQSNTMMIQMVATIIEKDGLAYNALVNWIESRKDKLIALKIKTVGGISVTNTTASASTENQKVIVDANNINNIINSIPNNNNTNAPATPLNAIPSQNIVHGENPLIPRQPTGSYQHSIHANPVNNNNVSPTNPVANHNMGMTENKNIHYEILNNSNHFADVHKQQNLQYVPEVIVPVTTAEFLKNYADSIMSIINNTFQMIHWQYIPLDVLKGILGNADKGLGYEVIQNADDCYINISRNGEKISTSKFKVQ